MVVTGTDAAAVVLPHLARQLIALRSQQADVAAQAETLSGTHPHVRGPDHTRPGSGSGPPPSSWPRPRTRTSRHRSPPGPLHRVRSRHAPLRLIDPRRARLPRRQQEAQARHVPLHIRITALRPRQPGLLPAQTRPRQTSQPGRPHPGPLPLDTPHRAPTTPNRREIQMREQTPPATPLR